jgi:hypothetical protein
MFLWKIFPYFAKLSLCKKCQLAGALYGLSSIPERWLAPLAWKDHIIQRADKLLEIGTFQSIYASI